MIPRRVLPVTLLVISAAACTDTTAPHHFTSATAPGVYFAVAENDSTYPQPVPQDSASGCTLTSVGGYIVLNPDRTYHGALFGLHFTCGSTVGQSAMIFRGTYEVQDTAILFHEQAGAQWDFAGQPSGGTSAGPDFDITRRNWSSYPSRLHLQRESNSAAASRRIQELNLPSGLDSPGNGG